MAKLSRYLVAILCFAASAYSLFAAYVILEFSRYSDRWDRFPGLFPASCFGLLAIFLLWCAWKLIRWGKRPIMPRVHPEPKFSLRAVFVFITVLAVILGFFVGQWRKVRERREVEQLLEVLKDHPELQSEMVISRRPYDYIPWTWRALGERPVAWMYALPADREARARALAAFPEASVGTPNARGRLDWVESSSLK